MLFSVYVLVSDEGEIQCSNLTQTHIVIIIRDYNNYVVFCLCVGQTLCLICVYIALCIRFWIRTYSEAAFDQSGWYTIFGDEGGIRTHACKAQWISILVGSNPTFVAKDVLDDVK